MSAHARIVSFRVGGALLGTECYLEIMMGICGGSWMHYNSWARADSPLAAIVDAVDSLPDDVPDELKKKLARELVQLSQRGVSE